MDETNTATGPPPDAAKVDVDQQDTELHSQSQPSTSTQDTTNETPPSSIDSELPTSSKQSEPPTSSHESESLTSSILKTKINHAIEPTSTTETEEDVEPDAFQRMLSGRLHQDSQPKEATDVKQEQIKVEHIKVEPSDDGGSSLFVSQDTTSDRRLKRVFDHIKPDPEQAKPKRKCNRNKNKVDPYDDAQEKDNSNLAVDKECFEKAEKLSRDIVSRLLNNIDALRKPGDGEREVDNLREEIRRAGTQTAQSARCWTVGFLGDTASGKSSIINSLLNEEEVAAASDDGGSGTHVIHEFAMSEPLQPKKFRVVVGYHPNRKIDNIVRESFANYYNFSHCSGDDMDEQDHDELRMKSDTAFDFFSSLLVGPGSKPSFKSADQLEAYLDAAKSAKDEDMIALLRHGIDAYMKTFERTAGATVLEADTLRELVDAKRQYAGPVKSQRSPWRLVRMINVHLSARILADGLRLADLPGLSDSDQTRVQSSRDYIKSCSTVVIVHPIPRVTSSDTIEKNLAYCLRTGRGNNTILVCTKTDDFQHDRERELSRVDAEFLAGLRRNEQELVNQISNLQDQKDTAREERDALVLMKTDKLLNDKEHELVLANAAVLGANIALRNEKVVDAMQNKIRSMSLQYTGEECETFQVFCVSNKVYNIHRKGYESKKPPELTVQGTEIPYLRAHLLSEPAKAKSDNLKYACTQRIPKVVLALALYCSRSRLERKKDMLPLVEAPMGQIETHFNRTVHDLINDCAEIMNSFSDSNDFLWEKEGRQKLKIWRRAHHSRFKKFCSNKGRGKLDKYGDDVDWNEEIVSILGNQFALAMRKVRKAITSRGNELREGLDGLLSGVIVSLQSMHAIFDLYIKNLANQDVDGAETLGMEDHMEIFYQAVDNKRDLVRSRVRKVFESLASQMGYVDSVIDQVRASKLTRDSNIRHDATSFEDLEHSYVLKAMHDAYAEAALLTGR